MSIYTFLCLSAYFLISTWCVTVESVAMNVFFFRVKDALAYVQYISHSILSKSLFKKIRLEPKSCWEYLLWMDEVM